MLIGYSVDTDILLTSRVLRSKEGTIFDRTVSAAKTGLLMTFTTITAVTISLLLTTSSTIKEIMTIMLIGLIVDIINTWIQNVAFLRYYLEHIKGRKAVKPMPSEAIVEEEINDNEVFEEEPLEEEKTEDTEKKDQ
jgi:preprotein translocase subunit SecF